jgi:putative salt-induced outer membrane protein YdiY
VKSIVLGRLAMKFSYSVKHNSQVPVAASKTDTETSVTLVYSF